MLKKLWILIITGGIIMSMSGCSGSDQSAAYKDYVKKLNSKVTAVMHTNMGDITIALFPDKAPKTVANFIGLAKKGYYNDVIFHRVISDFMIQSGDPTGKGTGGTSIYGGYFEDEFTSDLFNFRGALSMANTGNAGTNSSQFFIVQNKSLGSQWVSAMKKAGYPDDVIKVYEENGGTPYLDQKHTVFGYVTAGMDVVDKIATAKTVNDRPVSEIKITSIDITE